MDMRVDFDMDILKEVLWEYMKKYMSFNPLQSIAYEHRSKAFRGILPKQPIYYYKTK